MLLIVFGNVPSHIIGFIKKYEMYKKRITLIFNLKLNELEGDICDKEEENVRIALKEIKKKSKKSNKLNVVKKS